MTTYRLPEALGGAELEPVRDLPVSAFVWFEIPGGGGTLEILRDRLTVVDGPDLPPEPNSPAYVVDRDENVWQRRRTGWQRIVGGQQSWAELWRDVGPLIRLVPDPFVEPVALPWRSESDHRGDTTVTADLGCVADAVRTYSTTVAIRHTPASARWKARALWAAADAAEATS